jgi:PAS domain S-box-containing protein
VESFQWLAQEIQQGEGEALVMRVPHFEGLDDSQLIGMFNRARQDEYEEILVQLADLERQIGAGEWEERTADFQSILQKIQKQQAEVARIDYFQCPQGTAVAAQLKRIRRHFTLSGDDDELQIAAAVVAEYRDIALMDKNRDVIYVNHAFTSIFGYSNEEIIGQPISILGSEKSLINSAQTEDVTDALMQQKSIWQGEVLRKCKSGQYIPCLLSAAGIHNEKNEVAYFIGTYLDLRSMKHTDQMQKNALKATINAVCKAIDELNVLKGQHQEQVTDLAVAIAFEMGKDLNFIEGLTLASHLHDLGEMYIPPEISAKEGAHSAADNELVKIHPIKAYEILKDIKFPRPVANIIQQHHERMNGSGYPKGLKGDEIM